MYMIFNSGEYSFESGMFCCFDSSYNMAVFTTCESLVETYNTRRDALKDLAKLIEMGYEHCYVVSMFRDGDKV